MKLTKTLHICTQTPCGFPWDPPEHVGFWFRLWFCPITSNNNLAVIGKSISTDCGRVWPNPTLTQHFSLTHSALTFGINGRRRRTPPATKFPQRRRRGYYWKQPKWARARARARVFVACDSVQCPSTENLPLLPPVQDRFKP